MGPNEIMLVSFVGGQMVQGAEEICGRDVAQLSAWARFVQMISDLWKRMLDYLKKNIVSLLRKLAEVAVLRAILLFAIGWGVVTKCTYLGPIIAFQILLEAIPNLVTLLRNKKRERIHWIIRSIMTILTLARIALASALLMPFFGVSFPFPFVGALNFQITLSAICIVYLLESLLKAFQSTSYKEDKSYQIGKRVRLIPFIFAVAALACTLLISSSILQIVFLSIALGTHVLSAAIVKLLSPKSKEYSAMQEEYSKKDLLISAADATNTNNWDDMFSQIDSDNSLTVTPPKL